MNNENYEMIYEVIKNAQHIVLIAHKKPDADSIGSASAMYTFLMRLQKKVSFFCETQKISPRVEFIPWFDKIRHVFPKKADIAICFDCGSATRLGVDVSCDLINFDHHVSNEYYARYNCIDTDAASTTSVLFDFFTYIYDKTHERLNTKMATALYAGLIDDTQNFIYQATPRAFDMARKLLEAKADVHLCNRELFQKKSLAALRLQGLMYTNMQLFYDARLVVHLVSRDMMDQTGALEVDCETALEESLHLSSVCIAILLRENKDGPIKGSLRTNSVVDMNKIANAFGGGGHKTRAGFEVYNSDLNQVFSKVLIEIKKELI